MVTTHDLLLYINREYPGFFETGVAFNIEHFPAQVIL